LLGIRHRDHHLSFKIPTKNQNDYTTKALLSTIPECRLLKGCMVSGRKNEVAFSAPSRSFRPSDVDFILYFLKAEV